MTIQEQVFDAMKRHGSGPVHLNDIMLISGLNKSQVQGALYHLGTIHKVADSKGNGYWKLRKNAEFTSKTPGYPAKQDAPAPPAPNGNTEAGDLFEMVGKTTAGQLVVRSVDDKVIYTITPIAI